MKTRTYKGNDLQRTLIGMITDRVVLERIATIWSRELFGGENTPQAKISSWCISYFKKHGEAPRGVIRDLFERWAVGKDDSTVRGVERLLASLSDEHVQAECPTSHTIEVAERYFTKVKQERLCDDVQNSPNGKADEAIKAYAPINLRGTESGLVRLSEIDVRPVSWLWQGWVPRGELTIIDGDMGSGKTQIAIDLAARVTRGWMMPPSGRRAFDRDRRKPGNVIFLSSEDDAAWGIRPRFEVVGSDPERLFVLGTKDDGTPPLKLPDDKDKIGRMIEKHKARLLVMDPLYGFTPAKVDTNNDPRVRDAMMRPLSDIAHRTGTAFLLTRHLNKKWRASHFLQVAWK